MIKLLMEVTISSSIVAMVIVLFRIILKSMISSKWKYYLWFIFLARLLILPFPESNISVFNILNNNQYINENVYESINRLDNKELNTRVDTDKSHKDEITNDKYENNIENVNTFVNEDKSKYLILGIYSIGVIISISYYLITYKIFSTKMSNKICNIDEVYIKELNEIKRKLNISKNINIIYGKSSFIYGIKDVNLVIQKNLDEVQLKAILLHELIHYKYGDLYINWIMILFKSIYWFNPVVHFVSIQIKKDCEKACDERVIESKLINKVDYSKSLLKNALNSNKFSVGTTSFSKNKSDIKGRIENMKKLRNKKTTTIIISSFIVLIIGGLCLTNSTDLKSDKEKTSNEVSQTNTNSTHTYEDLIEKLKSTNKIAVYHDYHGENAKPVYVKDKNIINNYLNLINKKVDKSSEEISNSSVNNQKLVFYTDNETIEVKYSYDDLYNFGFITYNGQDTYLDYDFFRLISNTQRYSPKASNIDEDTKKLFEKYNWTPSFLISSHKVEISDDLNYAPEKGIDEVYWAYNLQFSKSIGLDFSNLLGEKVNAEVYYLLEQLPNLESPIIDARAVVLKHNGKIVGVYIDSGILNRALCSLDRKSFKAITGLDMEDYLIKNHIDKNSTLNKKVEKLATEELIKLYYKSQSDKDIDTYLSTLDMGAIVSLLEPNNFDIKSGLFNTLDKSDEIFKQANKVEVLEVKDNDEIGNMKDVSIRLNILKSNEITMDKGIYNMIVNMRKNENGVYKINSVGF